MKNFITALTILFTIPALAADIDCSSVLLRSVDKLTGRTKEIKISTDTPKKLGSLNITLQRCLKKPPEETPENSAFLLIEEENREGETNQIFNGWMLSSNPAISPMEHPIWDIWVVECIEDTPIITETFDSPITPVIAQDTIEIDELEDI